MNFTSEILKTKTIGLRKPPNLQIGDAIRLTSFPENYFRNTGKKLVDLDGFPVFDFNPFVERGIPCDIEVDILDFVLGGVGEIQPSDYEGFIRSFPELYCKKFGFECFLRHPNLYFLNDAEMIPNRVTYHSTGQTVAKKNPHSKGEVPWLVEQYLGFALRDWDLIQVGSINDDLLPHKNILKYKDATSLTFWEQVSYIATSSIFIGVNSAWFNVAMCYPRISKKVILVECGDKNFEYTKENRKYHLKNFFPSAARVLGEKDGKILLDDEYFFEDVNCQYYNITEQDIGVTFSYRKIL